MYTMNGWFMIVLPTRPEKGETLTPNSSGFPPGYTNKKQTPMWTSNKLNWGPS